MWSYNCIWSLHMNFEVKNATKVKQQKMKLISLLKQLKLDLFYWWDKSKVLLILNVKDFELRNKI